MNLTDPPMHYWETSQRKTIYIIVYLTLTVDNVKIFCVLHNKVAMLSRRLSERGTRNHYQIIFRKVLKPYGMHIENVDQKMNFLWLWWNWDLNSFLQIFLNILEYIWWSWRSSFLIMGMGKSKRWCKVICVVKLKVIQPQPKYKNRNLPNLKKRLLRDNWEQKEIGISKCYLVILSTINIVKFLVCVFFQFNIDLAIII